MYPDRRKKEIGGDTPAPSEMPEDTTQVQAIAGPGPSTIASRQAQSTPSPTTTPQTRAQNHEDETAPLEELDKLADELEELLGRDDILEVTDEMTESTVITQILARVQAGQEPLSAGAYPDRLEEEEWIEVDNLLDGDIPSQPSIRPISMKEATDHPRLQLVLKSITKRIMKRRRTFRRTGQEKDEEVAPAVPPSTPYHSPESVSSPKSSPSKRSSPFKVLAQAKSAMARRIHFRSSPTERDVTHDDQYHIDIDKASDHEVPPTSTDHDTSFDSTSSLPAEDSIEIEPEVPQDESPALLFPHDSLIANIHRFMRYSSAAYGVSPYNRHVSHSGLTSSNTFYVYLALGIANTTSRALHNITSTPGFLLNIPISLSILYSIHHTQLLAPTTVNYLWCTMSAWIIASRRSSCESKTEVELIVERAAGH